MIFFLREHRRRGCALDDVEAWGSVPDVEISDVEAMADSVCQESNLTVSIAGSGSDDERELLGSRPEKRTAESKDASAPGSDPCISSVQKDVATSTAAQAPACNQASTSCLKFQCSMLQKKVERAHDIAGSVLSKSPGPKKAHGKSKKRARTSVT